MRNVDKSVYSYRLQTTEPYHASPPLPRPPLPPPYKIVQVSYFYV